VKTWRPGGVPLHPALVHFPVVFWTLDAALESWAILTTSASAWRLALWSLAAGCLSALPAMAAGVPELLALDGESAQAAAAWRHAMLMATAWTVFTLLLVLAPAGAPPPTLPALVHCAGALAGFALLAAGGHAGGRLVYHHGIGMRDRP